MGQFVKLVNTDNISIFQSHDSGTFKDVSGNTQTFNDSYYDNAERNALGIFFVYSTYYGNNITAESNNYYPFPYASSDSSIPYSQTSITNQVGSCAISFTKTSTGWTANITITSSADATVNSLLFTRKLMNSSSSYISTLCFAYVLDSPVELNADNNHTANLTMAISYTE